MGIFDFLKKNKNIENDNGLNEIYYDDGKGLISKSYHLKNGLKCGLYQEWFQDGSLAIEGTYKIIEGKEIIVGDIINCIKNSGIDRLDGFFPFDLYEGGSVKHGKKSIAFLILMKDTYKTLEENEVNNIVKQVLTVLQDKFKAELR